MQEQLNSQVLVLAGGGIDSTVCMYRMKDSGTAFRALHVDYGQQSCQPEWESVKAVAAQLDSAATQIRLVTPHQFKPGEVQGRNAAFVFLALMHLLPTESLICLGIHAGTPFFDCSTQFFNLTAQLVAEQTDSCVRLIAPLLELSKSEIVGFARSLGIPLDITYSCQLGLKGGCGKCHSCKDRRILGC